MENTLEGKVTPILDGFCSVVLEMDAPKGDIKQLHAYFALDHSGSMSGGKMISAKDAVKQLMLVLKEDQISMTLIAFDDHATLKDSRDPLPEGGYDSLIKFCDGIEANGGTVFTTVFAAVKDQMAKYGDANNVIIFVTDGQDGSGADKLKKTMEEFRQYTDERKFRTCIHAIGVGSDHDANLLTNLIKNGSAPGTFQYVADSAAIKQGVANLQGAMDVGGAGGVLRVAREIEHRVTFELIEEPLPEEEEAKGAVGRRKLRGVAFLKEDDLKRELELEMTLNKVKTVFKVRPLPSGLALTVSSFADFVRSQVVLIIDVLRKGNVPEAQRGVFIKLIQQIDGKLDEMMEQVRKLSSLERKREMPVCLELKELTAEFYNALKEDLSGRGLENVALAKLNDVVYRGVLKRGLAKKLNKRYEQNAGLMENTDKEIEKIVKGLDPVALRQQYGAESKKLEEQGYCLLSTKNWLEAVLDFDCICATFHVERSQAAIADPNQVLIRAVNTTQLTCESFMQSALFYKYNADKADYTSPSFVKGEPASTLVKGLPDEIITGIMPLYINELHWKIARLKMKPLLGWTATLDVLGYMPTQVTTIPFLLFAKAAEDLSSECQRKNFVLIKDTCMAIYTQFKKTLLPDLLAIQSKYLTEPLVRTVDSVPHNQVHLAHLYFAMLQKDLTFDPATHFRAMLPLMVEEELRRRVRNPEPDHVLLAFKLLAISRAEYVDSYGFNLEEMTQKPEEVKSDPKVGLEKIDGKIATLCPEAVNMRTQFTRGFEPNHALYSLARLMGLFELEPYKSLEQIGINSNEKLLTLMMQCLMHHVNADRRAAIQNGEYVSPFDQAQAEAFVQKQYVNAIVSERQKKDAAVLKNFMSCRGKAMAAKFANADSLETAISVLELMSVNSPIYGELIHYVTRNPMKHPLEKAEMLVQRSFKGVPLLRVGRKPVPTWNYGQTSVFRIWRVNRDQAADLKAWQQIFPVFAEKLAFYEELWTKGTIYKSTPELAPLFIRVCDIGIQPLYVTPSQEIAIAVMHWHLLV